MIETAYDLAAPVLLYSATYWGWHLFKHWQKEQQQK